MIPSGPMNGGAAPRLSRPSRRARINRNDPPAIEWTSVIDQPTESEEGAIESDADESADVEHLRFTVTKDLTRRIDQYLTDRISHLSRSGVQKLIEEGLVKVNGRVIKASYRPRDGDKIELVAPPEPISELIPEPIPLDIV